MKSKQLLSVIAIAILFSCSKSKTGEIGKAEKLRIKLESVVASTSADARIQSFNLLTSEEKYILWKDHFQKAKTQFSNAGQTQKVNLMNDLLANFTSSIFDDTHASDVFLNYFLPTWIGPAETVFSFMELYDITFDPSVTQIGQLRVVDETGSDASKCFCHTGTSGFSCTKVTISIPPSVESGICERTPAYCVEKPRGCGLFWLYSCDGNHCQF